MIKRLIQYLKSKFSKKEKYIGEFLEKKKIPEEQAANKFIQHLSNIVEFSKKPFKFKVKKQEPDQFFFDLPKKEKQENKESYIFYEPKKPEHQLEQTEYSQYSQQLPQITETQKEIQKEDITEKKEGLFNMFN